MLLNSKNALITGAAGGIGRALILVYARQGANIWAFALEPSNAFEAFCDGLAEENDCWVKPLYCDLTDAVSRKAAFNAVMADKLPLDILVNNAGVMGDDKLFQMVSDAEARSMFEVNYIAAMEVCRFATRMMARRRCGAVVNIASVAGLDGDSRADYSASKAALIAATKALAREMAPLGIRVNALAPGMTNTSLIAGLAEKAVEDTLAKTLLHRMAEPEEIANVAAFLGSDMASYVTGQTWRVDGGRV